MAVELQFVGLTPVIESWLNIHPEAHRPAHHAHQPNQPVAIGCYALKHRHEIEHLADPLGAQEPRNQDRGVWEVHLPAHVVVPVGADAEVTTAVVVQQGREDARGVETGTAHPVDGAVGTYEGRRLQVADQAVLTDVWVAVHRCVLSTLLLFSATWRNAL